MTLKPVKCNISEQETTIQYSRDSKECNSDVRALVHNTERVPYN